MTAPGNPLVEREVGAYRILEVLAHGGMAIVYRALQPALDREVALKELARFPMDQAALAERFVRESRVAGSLKNEHIVYVNDFFEHEAVPYIAMELLERSLRPYVGGTSLEQVAGVLEGILAGLAHAHARGIIHRDLKPENVLVTSDGAVKIADFGIAKAFSEVCGLTATGTTLGTPEYMAPEQAKGGEISPRTDLYAVGVIAYELLTGSPPFRDTGEAWAVLMRHIGEQVPDPREFAPELDGELAEWLLSMLAKEPADRPPSAEQAWTRVENVIVRLKASFWRRAARLGTPGLAQAPSEGSRPLSEAEFPIIESPTPIESVRGYVTFGRRGAKEPEQPPLAAPPAPPPALTPPIARPVAPDPPDVPVVPDASTLPPKTPTPAAAPAPAPAPRPRRRRRLVALVAAGAIIVAGGTAGALQATGPAAERALDLRAVETRIKERLEPVNSVVSVRCPRAPIEKGHTMECTAILSGNQLMQVTVMQLDDRGAVHVQPHV